MTVATHDDILRELKSAASRSANGEALMQHIVEAMAQNRSSTGPGFT
jgi:hypothetical protein